MDPAALEQQMLEAAIAASLEELRRQNDGSSSQSHRLSSEDSITDQSESTDVSKLTTQIQNSIEAPDMATSTPHLAQSTNAAVVDLTNDSSSDQDVREIFPKSKSIIGSKTDEETVANLSADDSDEELRRAIALSIEGAQHGQDISGLQEPAVSQEPTEISQAVSNDIPKPQSIFGLDRKQMEQERLARLAKRKAQSSPPSQPAQKASRITEQHTTTKPFLNNRASLPHHAPASHICNTAAANDPTSRVQPTARPLMQFPYGAVKKTHLAHAPRTGNEITIEEVFQREDLKVAVLSSFLWDIEWLFTKLDTRKTKFILMMGAKEEATRRQYREETAAMSTLELCFPPMEPQVNNMHSKLILLYHPGYLRIAVPTANLTRTDWGEDGLMENTVFLIDLPRITASVKAADSNTFFKEELVYFLKASNLRDDAIKALDEFDFSKTARYAFVHTVGGSRIGESWKRTGYCGLGRAVTQMGLQPSGPINIAYVASSVGSLTDEFLRAIYLAAKGDDGLTDYKLRNTRDSTTQTNDPQRKRMLQLGQEWQNRLLVYFPSAETVRLAHANPDRTAGTVCFSSRWWLGEKFPRNVLKDCESERGVLMHNKLMYVWFSEPIQMPDGNECKGWAYVGSANISESAWGRLVKDRSTGQPKLNCRNWECGVLVPVTTPKSSDKTLAMVETTSTARSDPQELPVETFQNTVPVPMKLPGANLTESRPPWFFQG